MDYTSDLTGLHAKENILAINSHYSDITKYTNNKLK